MSSITYKNLYQLVVEEINKRVDFNTNSQYQNQTTRTSVSPVTGDGRSDASTAEIVTAIQDLLAEALPSIITEGLIVTATDPISTKVNISLGKGSVGGVLYTLENDTTIEIPFNNTYSVFYLVLYKNRILIESTYNSDRLTVAKIVVPKPQFTNLVQDDKDSSWNAYIVNFREQKLYGYNDKFEEDSIELLRDNIGKILADNIIGNIRLNEDLKILNTAGTLELDSNSMKLYDLSENLLAKFNQNGVYFYDTNGIELGRFTNIDARIGNILITKNSIESEDFIAGSSGFQLLDTGDVEFNTLIVRGTVYALAGEIGGWTIANNMLYATTTGIIKTSQNVEEGASGVVMDKDGLRGYDLVLGRTFNLPSDGSAPTFSSGIINNTIFEINTNAILRTSETVGDGSANSFGILINNTGLYGCGINQYVEDANLKALIDGTIRISGTIYCTKGEIGGVSIDSDKLSGGLIEGAIIRSPIIESSASLPRIRMDSTGFYYQITSSIGKYGTLFKYGDGTNYGSGVLAYLFNENYPVFSIVSQSNLADIRMYNRVNDPESGEGPHVIGDLICVDGVLKICSTPGSPGVFASVSGSTMLGFASSGGIAVGASTTTYAAFLGGAFGTTNFNSSSGNRQHILPFGGIARKFYVRTLSAQPADGNIVFTVRKNSGATSLTITIPINGVAETYSDVINEVTFGAGDLIDMEAINSSASSSALVGQWSLEYQKIL